MSQARSRDALAAAADLDARPRRSFMVGDRWRDIEAGRRAGCRTVFVDRGYAERRAEDPDAVVADLAEAVTWILGTSSRRRPALPDARPLRIKVFADGADLEGMLALAEDPLISGFTTNPTLMRVPG